MAMTSRSGAALIIALVVLAALLLLGLPFLFTQSSSLAGTRSFSHSQQALIGRASAENIGVEAGANAMDWHWRAGGVPQPVPAPPLKDEWTSLYWGLGGGTTLTPEIRPLTDGRTGVDLRIIRKKPDGTDLDPIYADQTLAGVIISDEHGKLDPNHLDRSAWTRLLEQVGVKDWDDGTVTANPTGPRDTTHDQLARALADLRFDRVLIPDGRITQLDQLLLAEPPTSAKPRHRLTRAELAQVAPYLSLHGMAQARGGLIDLGTVINDGQPFVPDSLQPGAVLAHPVFPSLVGSGTVIVDADDNGGSPGVSQPDVRNVTTTLRQNRALAIEAPPVVNLHEASAVVRTVLFNVPAAKPPPSPTDQPAPSTLTALTTYHIEPPPAMSPPAGPIDFLLRTRTWFDLLDPLGVVQDVLTANVSPSKVSLNEGASGPARPGDGLSYEPITGLTTLDAGAFAIRITGSLLERLPSSGYARLNGTEVSPNPMNPIGGSAQEYVFYRSCAVTGGSGATLTGVTRGMAMPPGSGPDVARRFFADPMQPLKVTILSARELPPLAIASPAIVTIETAATATDPAGRQTAQQARTVVAQTVAQETPLEARWERQSQFHATLAQRHGSLMASFPNAVDRIQGHLPDETVSPTPPPSPGAADPYSDKSIGVRPAVLRSPMTGSHIFHEWTAPLAGRESGNHALRGDLANGQQAAFNYTTGYLFPEGLRLTASQRLAWLLAPATANGSGFFAHPPVTNGTTVEIFPRQLGFWVRPDATWSGRTEPVILLEVRGPIANAGRALLGTPTIDLTAVNDARLAEGSTALQNYLGLVWYPGSNEFVLAFGTGAIEHVADYGPAVPSDNYAISTLGTESKSPAVDNSSLASDPTNYYPLAPARPMNRIEHRYHFDATSLRPGTWHLIQVAFSGTRPDRASIVVDGLVGRRVDDKISVTADGDHYALPRLTLATALAQTHQDYASLGASVYRVDAITLTGPADQVLPKRGMIRIGSEYISYQRLSGNTLYNCWRARRQDSVSGSTPATTEAHAIGDEVYPGGFHAMVPTLYTGGNTLAGPLSNGDVTVGSPHPYRVWANLARAPIYPPVPLSTDFILPSGETSIVLSGNAAMIDQFPPRGSAMINGDEVFFFTRAAGSNVLVADRWQTVPARPVPVQADRVCNSTTTIHLVSAELVGPDPTLVTRFPPSGLLQFYDANGATASHRAEWIQYQGLITRGGVGYVLNYNGFDASQRGQVRTAFAPRDLGVTTFAFPAGTRVLPIQSGGRLVETGDVLTVARQKLSKVLGEQPWQSVVRFAEKDGWGSPDAMTGVIPVADPITGQPFDTVNSRFAFCEAVPEHFGSQLNCHLLCWPCWNGMRELSSTGQSDTPVTNLDLLPWGNAWATGVLDGGGAAPTDDRRICLGADDERNISVPGTPTTMAIDALWSGTQLSAGNTSLAVIGIISATPIDVESPWISGTALSDASSIELQASGSLFLSQGKQYVLAMIGGEVFALEQRLDTVASPNVFRQDQARIVGRALLGSAARVHRGKEPILILPLGPVTPLTASLSPTDQNVAPFVTLDAPAVMIIDADGSSTTKPELLTAPNGWVAPWLRGMYGTSIGTWTVAPGSPAPLAVGWWPRFASPLPRVPPTVWPAAQRTAWTNALLRSRSYAWAGFPLRFHGASFYAAGTNGAPVVSGPSDFLGAQINVIDDADGFYQLNVRALAAGFEWQQSPIVQPSALGVFDASDVFASDFFRRPSDGTFRSDVSWKRNDPIPVDGAELRITWLSAESTATTMRDALLNLARHNRAPMIGPVRLRCQASSQVLSVEAAR